MVHSSMHVTSDIQSRRGYLRLECMDCSAMIDRWVDNLAKVSDANAERWFNRQGWVIKPTLCPKCRKARGIRFARKYSPTYLYTLAGLVEDLSNQVHDLMSSQRLSAQALAVRTGLPIDEVKGFLSGDTNMTLKTLVHLLDTLNIDVSFTLTAQHYKFAKEE